jgi:LysR family transcriptional regulator, benzoate and cis,cis-muconate-responsive activator of ben and cat genes
MDLRHLNAFLAVAEELSVTRAAERLHISQPPLSRSLRQLETELGVTLFVRHRNGVALTEEGRTLLEAGRRLAAAADDFLDVARQVARADVQRLRIGIGSGLWEAVSTVRAAYADRGERAGIAVKDVDCEKIYEQELREHTLDVTFARAPQNHAHVEIARLYAEQLVVVLNARHPLATRPSLRLRDIAREPLLLWDRHLLPGAYDLMLRLFEANRITPITRPTPGAGPYNQAGWAQVAEGNGLYIGIDTPPTTPRVSGGVAVVPLEEPGAAIDVCVVWRKNESSGPVLRFVDCAREVFSTPSLSDADKPQMSPAVIAGHTLSNTSVRSA